VADPAAIRLRVGLGRVAFWREFVELACAEVARHKERKGQAAEEVGIDIDTGEKSVLVDPRYFRPTEVDELLSDAGKATKRLGWRPEISTCSANASTSSAVASGP